MGELGTRPLSEQEVGRRRFLVRALGTSAVALPVPTIISVTPAGAITSPPPRPPTQVEPAGEARTPQAPAGSQVAPASRGQLPFTGADVDRLVVPGPAAVVGGAAMIHWSAPEPPATPPVPGDGP